MQIPECLPDRLLDIRLLCSHSFLLYTNTALPTPAHEITPPVMAPVVAQTVQPDEAIGVPDAPDDSRGAAGTLVSVTVALTVLSGRSSK